MGGGRLCIPFMIWSLLYSGLELLRNVHSGNEIHCFGFVYRFIVGKSATPFYYIVVLVQLTVITPWLIKIVKQNGIISRILWLVTPVYLVYLYSWCIATSVRNIISGMVWILLSRNSSALWMEIERQWICGCGYTLIKLC